MIIDNPPAAGSTIGPSFAAKAKPDGYTPLYGTVSDQAVATYSLAWFLLGTLLVFGAARAGVRQVHGRPAASRR